MPKRPADLLTVIAIAIVAYALTNQIHEALGHGGACVLVGGKPLMLNAIFFNCDAPENAPTALRIIAAGGSITNLLTAALLLAILATTRPAYGAWHYFLTLMLALNVLMPFGYFFFSGVAGIGDWEVVVKGAQPALLYRAGLVALGAFLYFRVAARLILPHLDPYLGLERVERRRRARYFTLTPYLAGGVTLVLAGLLNPASMVLVFTSAIAASFGGASWLAWYPNIPPRPGASVPAELPTIARSVPWIGVGAMVLVVYVGLLGPGIQFRPAG